MGCEMYKYLIFLFLLISNVVFCQKHIFLGTTEYSKNIILTIDQNKVYRGNSTYSTNIYYTLFDNKVYDANSTYSTNILLTLDNEGHIYKGNSHYSTNIIATIKDNRVYRGNSIYYTDLISYFKSNVMYVVSNNLRLIFDKEVSNIELASILYYLSIIQN